MTPLITIITPVFNAAAVVAQCIESVLMQVGDNYEHLIINGLSTDDTAAIVQRYQQTNTHIRLYTENDAGVYDAMNKGVGLAKGQWILFLGADDTLYEANVLQTITTYIRQQPHCELLYGDVFYTAYDKWYDGRFDTEKILRRNVCHQAIFYHHTVFEKEGLYTLDYRTEADYEMNLKCWLGNRITHCYVPLKVAVYADHGMSAAGRDPLLVANYPLLITDIILKSNRTAWSKIRVLSVAYRKIIQRYPVKQILQRVFVKEYLWLRLLAAGCMLLLFPFFMFKLIKND